MSGDPEERAREIMRETGDALRYGQELNRLVVALDIIPDPFGEEDEQ